MPKAGGRQRPRAVAALCIMNIGPSTRTCDNQGCVLVRSLPTERAPCKPTALLFRNTWWLHCPHTAQVKVAVVFPHASARPGMVKPSGIETWQVHLSFPPMHLPSVSQHAPGLQACCHNRKVVCPVVSCFSRAPCLARQRASAGAVGASHLLCPSLYQWALSQRARSIGLWHRWQRPV